MLYDRAYEDCVQARNIRDVLNKEKREPTNEEVQILERGMLTSNALNRIEKAQERISKRLSRNGYIIVLTNKTDWSILDIVTLKDYERILSNTKALYNSFVKLSTTPLPPISMMYFSELNDLEKILDDLDVLSENMEISFLYTSDKVFSGGE